MSLATILAARRAAAEAAARGAAPAFGGSLGVGSTGLVPPPGGLGGLLSQADIAAMAGGGATIPTPIPMGANIGAGSLPALNLPAGAGASGISSLAQLQGRDQPGAQPTQNIDLGHDMDWLRQHAGYLFGSNGQLSERGSEFVSNVYSGTRGDPQLGLNKVLGLINSGQMNLTQLQDQFNTPNQSAWHNFFQGGAADRPDTGGVFGLDNVSNPIAPILGFIGAGLGAEALAGAGAGTGAGTGSAAAGTGAAGGAGGAGTGITASGVAQTVGAGGAIEGAINSGGGDPVVPAPPPAPEPVSPGVDPYNGAGGIDPPPSAPPPVPPPGVQPPNYGYGGGGTTGAGGGGYNLDGTPIEYDPTTGFPIPPSTGGGPGLPKPPGTTPPPTTPPPGGLGNANLLNGIPAAFGAVASYQQTQALKDLAEKYMAVGEPSRSRYEASYAPGFSMESDPGYQGALDQSAKATLHGLSVNGNPAGSPNAWAASLSDLYNKTAYPALQKYRDTNATTGGIGTLTSAAPGAASGAVASQGNIYNAVGAGYNDIFNPKTSLADLLKTMGNSGTGATGTATGTTGGFSLNDLKSLFGGSSTGGTSSVDNPFGNYF